MSDIEQSAKKRHRVSQTLVDEILGSGKIRSQVRDRISVLQMAVAEQAGFLTQSWVKMLGRITRFGTRQAIDSRPVGGYAFYRTVIYLPHAAKYNPEQALASVPGRSCAI